jgi:hypothetical protein
MIFVDANIPMYLIGAQHPNKDKARMKLEELVRQRVSLVSSAEVLQEICHRYVAIDRREYIQHGFDLLLGVVDRIYPITENDIEKSKTLLLSYKTLSARDSLHLGTMQNLGINRIFSYNADLDCVSWVERLY